jgi:hypothetical protein
VTHQDRDPIFTATIFEVPAYDSGVPDEVVDEVRRLWSDLELGNDHSYWAFDGEDWDYYPLIREYLQSRGINTCLIHYWW